MPYPRKPHTICMLPNITRRAKKLSQFLVEHILAKNTESTAGTSRLEGPLVWSEEGIFVHWHAALGGWHFREIWRTFLQEYVPDFSLPQRVGKVKEGPLSGSLVLFSPPGTKILAANWVVVGSKPSVRALGPTWMQSAKATCSLCFSNFCSFSFSLRMVFYHFFTLLYISVLKERKTLWVKSSLLIMTK